MPATIVPLIHYFSWALPSNQQHGLILLPYLRWGKRGYLGCRCSAIVEGGCQIIAKKDIPHITSLRRQQDRNRRVSSLLTSWEDHWKGGMTPAADRDKQALAASVLWNGAEGGTGFGSCSRGRASHGLSWPNISLWDLYLLFHFYLSIASALGLPLYALVNFYQFWEEGMSSDMSSPWHLWLLSPSLHLWVWDE